ncbi:MAG: TonB-dependent receptor [Gammaproteobacteria bacterium]|nr:TonB-dependent receptor [Gammaproteobacteria bacterium]
MKTQSVKTLLYLASLFATAGSMHVYAEQEQDFAAEIEEILVIGSRGKPRSDLNRPVPIDVVDAEALRSTGQTDLGQMIQFVSPSFNSAKYGVNGTTNYAEPATLKGMSPDQVLVLVNGKRRHQFSTLNLNVAPGLGTIVTDLNSIPTSAIKRVEVLRDGAAAQYGSDAIAGIINLVLKDSAEDGTLSFTAGTHKAHDGDTFKISLNYGTTIFDVDSSFFNFTLETFAFEGTNRSDPYTGSIYPDAPADYALTGPTPGYPYLTTDPRTDRGVYPEGPFVVGNYGSNENDTYQAFLNTGFPLNDRTELYTFGGYSKKEIFAYGFFRNPSNYSRAVLEVFPDGYVPELPGESIDYSMVLGVTTELGDDWNLDVSFSTGHNHLDQWNQNSTNPSLGAATPTEFYVGRYEFNQNILEANVSKDLGALFGAENVNFAAGAQYREDNFQLHRGSPESYEVGPLAVLGKDVGASARPGISSLSENDLDRDNLGIYADVETDITDTLLLTTALRYEDYSDFGSNVSGKLGGRYLINDNIAFRGSYNRGFRAPSLGQIGSRVNTSTVQNGVVVITKQVSSDDSRLAQLGIGDPEAEVSNSFNMGLTGRYFDGILDITLDAFVITIDDRIVVSERLNATDVPVIAALFPEAKEIRFFTNHVDTETKGIELVATYGLEFLNGSSLEMTLAGTCNKTEVTGQKETPAEILAGATNQDLKLLGQTAIELIEVAQPKSKLVLSANYMLGDWLFLARTTRFGEVKAFSKGLSGEDPNISCDVNNRCVQTFGAKIVTDLSVSYAFTENFTLTLGGNNIFDGYPDKYNNAADGDVGQASSYANGQIPYSRNSNQFGFNGAYYYMTAIVSF